MINNKLIIAAAGSGKTTFLVNKALSVVFETVLITTFTEANEQEIRNRIIAQKGYMPRNVEVQTWFSFLLQHGVRPYQSALNDQIHEQDIGFYLTSQKSGKKIDKNGDPILANGHPMFWGEDNFERHYFTSDLKIYSDKISKFVCKTDKASKGEVTSRISRIYQHIYIDEVQDLAGYDLDVIKLLFKSNASVLLVGDPRQVTYLTHLSAKYKEYADGKIKTFVEKKLGKKIQCETDEITLNVSHRNNQMICDYSAKLYSDLPAPVACQCDCCTRDDEHLGVFIIKPSYVEQYLKVYNPVQLRWSAASDTHPDYKVQNFGESKGATMERVLIYPTKDMKEWIKNNSSTLSNEARAKLYVGLTRARLSSTVVLDYQEGDNFDGIENFTFDSLD
ncbi:MAG: UvrD-helicase domain-containing protein [Chloroflexota bacterium]